MTDLDVSMEKIALSEARTRFAELAARAAGGERFVILYRERPLAAMISVGGLERLERSVKLYASWHKPSANLKNCLTKLRQERSIP